MVTNLPISLYICLYTCVFLLQVLSTLERIKLVNVTGNNGLTGEAFSQRKHKSNSSREQNGERGKEFVLSPCSSQLGRANFFYSRILLQIIDAIMEVGHLVVYVVNLTFYISYLGVYLFLVPL